MDHEAVFEFDYPDAERACRVERSVRVEIGDIDGNRSAASLERDGATLTVTVDAADLVALRAGCTTWLSLVSVAERCGAATAAADG